MPYRASSLRAVPPALLIVLGLAVPVPAGAAEEPHWGDGDAQAANELAARGNTDPTVVAAAIAATRDSIAAAPRDPARYRAAISALHADAVLAFWKASGTSSGASHEEIAAAAAPVVAARHQEAVAVGRAWARALPGEESSLALADLLGRDAGAEGVLRQLIEREPLSVAGHQALARWLRDAEREEEISPILEALVAREGVPAAAFRLLVDHYTNTWLPTNRAKAIARWRKRFPDDREAMREQLRSSDPELDRTELAALAERLLAAVPPPTTDYQRQALRGICWSMRSGKTPVQYERCMRMLLAAGADRGDAAAAGDLATLLVGEARWSELEELVAGASSLEKLELARRLANEASGLARAGRCRAALRALEQSRESDRSVEPALDVAETLTYCVDREQGAAVLLAWARQNEGLGSQPWRLRQLPADPAFLAPLVELLRARLAEAPSDANLNEALEAVLEPFGDVPARVRHLMTWSALAPEKTTISMSLGRLFLAEGEPGEAAVAFADVVARSPDNAQAWTGLVEAQLAAGLNAEAARSAEAATAAGERVLTRLVAIAAEGQQSWRRAADSWARHLALVPSRELLAQDEDRYLGVLRRLGDLDAIDAWLAARAPVASSRRSMTAEAYVGGAWLKLGFPSRARLHYEAALAADPEDDDAVYGLAQAAADEGRESEAAALYRRALAHDPAEGGRAMAVSRYLREHGDAAGALEAIRAAAEKEPEGSWWIRVELARDLRAAGDAAASLALTDLLLGDNEHAHLVRLERGEALAALGRDAEARTTFDDFLERTASLAAKRSGCNCNCELLGARDALLARLRAPEGSDATVAPKRAADQQ